MAMLIRECSGIVCLCLTDTKIQQWALPPMTPHNSSQYGTPFTISIEACHGVTTGVSGADRLTTIQTAITADTCEHDQVKPGHVFPLHAHPDGVIGRQGHT